MAPTQLQHRRAHNLLLISKLLYGRDASPFTLVIDSLEQSGKRLIREFIKRATIAKTRVIYVSFETLKVPRGVDVFIPASKQNPQTLQKEISAAEINTSKAVPYILLTASKLISLQNVYSSLIH